MTEELKVVKQSIVNAYVLKTGKDAAEVASDYGGGKLV